MTPATPESGHHDPAHGHPRGMTLAHLSTGAPARTTDGAAIGQLGATLLDLRSGRIAFALVTLVPAAGSLAADRLAAVPWERVTLDADGVTLTIAATAATVRGAPTLALNGWPDPADPTWEAQVMRHYGGDATKREHSFAEELGLRSPFRDTRGG